MFCSYMKTYVVTSHLIELSQQKSSNEGSQHTRCVYGEKGKIIPKISPKDQKISCILSSVHRLCHI